MQVKNILIVDDDNEDSEFFTTVVQQINPGIEVQVATSKKGLFEKLEQQVPDLLFIDSFLQKDSGHSSIKEMKEDPRFRTLPVVMYTGAADMKNIKLAFEAGASVYIVKPHTLSEIKSVLQTVLQKPWDDPHLPKQYYLNNTFIEFSE